MDAFIGMIIPFAGSFAPRGWAMCQGQLLSIAQNSAVFAILGTTYGGDGQNTFGLPNLSGRVIVGQGNLPGGQNYALGQVAGTETVTLTTAQIPLHSHGLNADATVGTTGSPSNANIAEAVGDNRDGSLNAYTTGTPGTPVTLSSTSIAPQGGNQSHDNRQPYTVVNYIICLQGIFPSRN